MATGMTGKKIQRETSVAWWCPFDDHSNSQLVGTCGGCGAIRDGDRVKLPKALADMVAAEDPDSIRAAEAQREAQTTADRAAALEADAQAARERAAAESSSTRGRQPGKRGS